MKIPIAISLNAVVTLIAGSLIAGLLVTTGKEDVYS
jgi:hypothetical protein